MNVKEKNIDHVGLLNRIVRFDTNEPDQQGAGWQDGYSELLTTRGGLKELSGTRLFSNGEIVVQSTHELIVRYDSLLETNLRPSIKIIIDGETYTPQSWNKINGKNHLYRFYIAKQV